MTPLESKVLDTIVSLNRPMDRDDPPYPASLMPIVVAVIDVVCNHETEVL